MFNNKNLTKLSIKTSEWRHWQRSGVFTVNFACSSASIVTFEQVKARWVMQYMYFGTCETSMMKLFRENNINDLRKIPLPLMLDRYLDASMEGPPFSAKLIFFYK